MPRPAFDPAVFGKRNESCGKDGHNPNSYEAKTEAGILGGLSKTFFSFCSKKSARSTGMHLRNIIIAAVLVLNMRNLHTKRLKSLGITPLLLSANACRMLSNVCHMHKK